MNTLPSARDGDVARAAASIPGMAATLMQGVSLRIGTTLRYA